MESAKEGRLINKKNPEWKVLVTENEFLLDKVSFSQQVEEFLKELQQGQQIPPNRRNSSVWMLRFLLSVGMTSGSMVFWEREVAAKPPPLSPIFIIDTSHFERSEKPQYWKQLSFKAERETNKIPPVGRNDKRIRGKEERVAAKPPPAPLYLQANQSFRA